MVQTRTSKIDWLIKDIISKDRSIEKTLYHKKVNFNDALVYLLSFMKYSFDFFLNFFSLENKMFDEMNLFYKIDNDCKRIDTFQIEYTGKKEHEMLWTEFWKLFLCNLKLLMLYHEKKEENELSRLFPLKK